MLKTIYLANERIPAVQNPRSQSGGGINDVVEGGYCVGCGGCASLKEPAAQMHLTEHGMFRARLREDSSPATAAAACAVCPFSNASLNEDRLAEKLFTTKGIKRHSATGSYLTCYAGHVEEQDYRSRGSSGGMASWLQCRLLELGLADYVINVRPVAGEDADDLLFRYTICSSVEEVQRASKSRYYPIEMSEVMQQVREKPGRYVFVGLPCYVKTARSLCRIDPLLRDRVRWFIGLVCGHLKSKRFAEYLGWQLGVEPSQLGAFDFRKKLSERSADDYGVAAQHRTGGGNAVVSEAVRHLDGGDWGRGYFKYKACDYCDDVLAETADVVVGDAWLPNYVKDWRGTNVVVVRNPEIKRLIETGQREGRLHLDVIEPDAVAQSQDAGLRHRREGLRFRLHLREKEGTWAPKKRVTPSASHLSAWNKKRHQLREALRDRSHEAFSEALATGEKSRFSQLMKPVVWPYEALNAPRRAQRMRSVARRLRTCFLGLMGRL